MSEVDPYDEKTSDGSLEAQINERYRELSHLLRYVFKEPSPYYSKHVKLGGRNGLWRRKERIRPIAFYGVYTLFDFMGVTSGTGRTVPFLWMADDGALVVQSRYEYVVASLDDLVRSTDDDYYELLVLWLSNEADGAIDLIGKRIEAGKQQVVVPA